MKQQYRRNAELWRALARPKRLEILELLGRGEQNVGELARTMGALPVSVSQELAPLRRVGVVETRRAGKSVYYRLATPRLIAVFELLAEVMRDVSSRQHTFTNLDM